MKFRIHFETGEYKDFFDVESKSINKIKKIVINEIDKRKLNKLENNLWSEQLS